MTAPLLLVENLTKAFGTNRALADVSLDVLPGEVHALVGENGAGKSTLLKLVTGALRPDAGRIEVAGRPIEHLTPTRARQLEIACVHQHPALFPDLTVGENLALRLETPRALGRVDWRSYHERARAALAKIGAEISPESLVRDLSMPEKQLVEIACVIGSAARVVLLDEPTASLTEREQIVLFELVRNLRQQNTGFVYVSHRLDEIFALANRVTVLRDGRVVHTGAIDDLTPSTLIHLMVGRDLPTRHAGEPRRETQPLIAVKNLACRAAGISSVTFGIGAGEIFGLAGLVGAGRTELARTLFGLTPADGGEIEIDGMAVSIRSPGSALEHGIAYVPEDRTRHGVVVDLPIQQNITLGAHPRFFPFGWLRPHAENDVTREFIRKLEIRPPWPGLPVSSLSGGNQQKVAVARGLATQPRVLILDEPTQGVDIGAKAQIHELIRKLSREGMSVLLISSDLPELLALSDRVGVMRERRLTGIFPANTEPQVIMAAAFGNTSQAA